ncbi:hypothetical protein [Kibdelosporangium phytohabitans]|uniref:Uncharacterized protein n=1 Tax=Kibdelosporangium phytohabitans TaxID=860235 RepID=A0A0N7F3R8_9PSEU|nr:hypothetical protein [Kibdelosporangium phytohabitans]ALG09391.1 hypothetical protein AOZ06_22970 [Kibdelosporangium phytohabitans]MBE1469339.1 hypothetical protein [Kibdelosporangium phytohabitans]
MTNPWGTVVSAVRSRPHGRVSVTFTPQGWEVRRCPVAWDELRVWFWWSFGLSLVLAWIGAIPVFAFDAPKEVAFPFALPGALLLAGLLIYGLVAAVVEFFGSILVVFGLLTRKGRRRLFATPARTPQGLLMVLPAHAVVGARATHHWRRVVVTVRMVDGVEFRYSRFGMRRHRQALQSGFAGILGNRLQAQHA